MLAILLVVLPIAVLLLGLSGLLTGGRLKPALAILGLASITCITIVGLQTAVVTAIGSTLFSVVTIVLFIVFVARVVQIAVVGVVKVVRVFWDVLVGGIFGAGVGLATVAKAAGVGVVGITRSALVVAGAVSGEVVRKLAKAAARAFLFFTKKIEKEKEKKHIFIISSVFIQLIPEAWRAELGALRRERIKDRVPSLKVNLEILEQFASLVFSEYVRVKLDNLLIPFGAMVSEMVDEIVSKIRGK